ncbi:MAG: FprA family A-type flavoprotein [Lachnospiraceae bacterium]|nr:FprA family A-type flavoprotein [Lachnospiraceae bacterium]
MKNIRKVTEDIVWIGASDRRLALFENAFPIPRGVSYNSYLINDDKTALMDTTDASVSEQFLENLKAALSGRKLDYLVINHMEPDHCATVGETLLRYPSVEVVGNAKTFQMLEQFFDAELPENRRVVVKEGDQLSLGKHNLTFVMAPMVHWPEAMFSYDATDKALFSADAFGTFGALNGNIFADEVEFERDWLPDARRYYTNIVGKYGNNVQAVLKKAAGIEISLILPLHGPVWRKDLAWLLDKYQKWSTYEAEEKGVAILYSSMYGHTASFADAMAGALAEKGIRNIAVYDVSTTDISVLIAEIFRFNTIVLASVSYNAGIHPKMEALLSDMKALAVQNKKVAVAENGTWAPSAQKCIRAALEGMKNMEIIEPAITIRSSFKENQASDFDALCAAVADAAK